MAEKIEREAAIAALNKVRDDQRVFKYPTASDFLSARDAIERAVKVLESLPDRKSTRLNSSHTS